jgi:trk system potassium uptake protein TrkH
MKSSPYFLGLLSSLVVMGGLGLMTMINLRYWYFWRRNFMRRGSLLLQTKVTLLMTLIMIVFGTVVFLIFEYNHALKDCNGAWLKLFNSFFQAASARTAGLNSVDLGQANPVTLAGLMILMFIGGGSGSMAGGIKVTTFFCDRGSGLVCVVPQRRYTDF